VVPWGNLTGSKEGPERRGVGGQNFSVANWAVRDLSTRRRRQSVSSRDTDDRLMRKSVTGKAKGLVCFWTMTFRKYNGSKPCGKCKRSRPFETRLQALGRSEGGGRREGEKILPIWGSTESEGGGAQRKKKSTQWSRRSLKAPQAEGMVSSKKKQRRGGRVMGGG